MAAVKKADWGNPSYTNTVIASGEDPTLVRWSVRPSWEDMRPASPSLLEVLQAAYGRQEGEAIMATLARTAHCRRSEIWQLRTDLSYAPPQ